MEPVFIPTHTASTGNASCQYMYMDLIIAFYLIPLLLSKTLNNLEHTLEEGRL